MANYFKGSIYRPTKKTPLKDLVLWIAGIFFLLGALAFINRFPLFALLALLGLILIPPGQRLIERMLRFRLTTKLKTIAASVLFLASAPLVNHYSEIDQQVASQQKLNEENQAKQEAAAQQKEQQRKDSLNHYVRQSNQFREAHKIEEANQQLQFAATFAQSATEKEQIEKQKTSIAAVETIDLVKAGKYQTALPEIENLLLSDPTNKDLLYNKAICYSKTGEIEEAVNILKPLIQSGHAEADELHEKINPLRKRVAYSVTRCWDGSISNATGRGACSHHGGVKNWNEPVYEEYRKYE
jgi:tetratricopeptide (TPR) repeat protein